jgi:hypothetical protein
MTSSNELKNLRTEVVDNKELIKAACRLTDYYCLDPLQPKDMDKIIHTDWWKCAEVLTDLVPYGKINRSFREAIGFILLVQTNPQKKNDHFQ